MNKTTGLACQHDQHNAACRTTTTTSKFQIAVKIFTLPSGTHEDAIETIVQEAENMLHLEHHRIVPLYGISSSLENKEIHIVMPFYHLGSLKSYITQYLHELKVDNFLSEN